MQVEEEKVLGILVLVRKKVKLVKTRLSPREAFTRMLLWNDFLELLT